MLHGETRQQPGATAPNSPSPLVLFGFAGGFALVLGVLAIVVMSSTGTLRFDLWVTEHLVHRSATTGMPAREGYHFLVETLSPLLVAGALGASVIWALARRDEGTALFALLAPAAAFLIAEEILKPIVGRRTYGGDFTFPSGTTTVVAASAMVMLLIVLRYSGWIATLCVAPFLAAACVLAAVGVVGLSWHYATDAIGGLAAGGAVTLGIAGIFALSELRRAISPRAAPVERARGRRVSTGHELAGAYGSGEKPHVSVVMPVRNEARHIARCLRAVLAQDYPEELVEIIVVDGDSEDDTLGEVSRVVEATPGRVRVVHNPKRIAPTALNLGIEHATGEIIVRVDGHCEIEPDYVRRCVEVLMQTGYECVGGLWSTEGETETASAIAAAQTSSFGVGNAAYRLQRPTPGLVDTVPFGAYPRRVFAEIGLFDEELVRNQDDEFNFRLIQAGGRVWYDPSIRSRYFSRATLPGLWRQYFEYGVYKVRVGQKRGGFASPRHLVPAVFVTALAASGLLALLTRRARWLGLVAGPYALANAAATLRTSRRAHVRASVVAAAFVTLHLAYGTGFLAGLRRWRRSAARGSISEQPGSNSS